MDEYLQWELFEASRVGDLEKVSSLIAKGVDVNAASYCFTVAPLLIACKNGHTDVVKLLLKNNADINITDYRSRTALHEACESGHKDLMDILLQHNADVNARDKWITTPLHLACSHRRNGWQIMVELYVDINIDVYVTPLQMVCTQGRTDAVETLLRHNADVNVKNDFGSTPLHDACQFGNADMVDILLQHNADVHMTDKERAGTTPLQVACMYGNADMVDILLQHNADANVTDQWGNIPVHVACKFGNTDMVDIFLQHNAEVNLTDKDGRTLLHYACMIGKPNMVDILLRYKADVNARDKVGKTPLHVACESGHIGAINMLLQHNADANARDEDGQRPADLLKTKELQARFRMSKDFPDEIRGTNAKKIFRKAISKGTVPVHHVRLMIVGHYGVGKTTITKALLQDRDQIGDTQSTDGIDIYVGRSRIDLNTKKWEKRSEEQAKRITVRQKIQQIMYDQRHKEILEEKSWNPFSDNWMFKKGIGTLAPVPNIGKSTNARVGLNDPLSEKTKGSLSSKKKVVLLSGKKKGSLFSKKKVDLLSGKKKGSLSSEKPVETQSIFLKHKRELHNEDEAVASSNVVSGDIKEFLPQHKTLLPQKGEHVDIGEFDKDMCELEIWDFAGQAVFYTTHQAFLSPRCIYPLVIDGRKGLHETIADEKLIPGEFTLQEIEEFIRFWIFSIVTYARGKIRGFPKIIPVITHMDQITEDERRGKIEYIFKEIERICNEYHVLDHVILDVRLSVNALNPDDPAYSVLRDVILEVAQTYPDWGQLMPAAWVPLEHSMMHMKAAGYKILPLSCLEEINRRSEFQPLEDEELLSFLDFQHSLGNILYFSDKHLRHNVIMHPKWLIDALRSLITAEQFLQNDKTKQKMLTSLSESGTLKCSLLVHLWNNDEHREFYNNAEYLLHSMVKMDLLAEPVVYDDDGSAVQGDQFIVPSMVRLETSIGLIEELSPGDSSAALLFTFKGKFLPKAIFNRLIASCINLWPLEKVDNKRVISSEFCSFRVDVSHRVSLKMLPYQILTTITATHQSQRISTSLCGGIRHVLFHQLTRICQVHKDVQEETEKFFIEIPCCAKHLRCTQKFRSDALHLCDHHEKQEMAINLSNRIWIGDDEYFMYPQDEDCTRSNQCPCLTNVSLSVQDLGRLSRRLKGNPENIEIRLDIDSKLLANEEDHYKHGRIGKTEFYFRVLLKAKDNRLKAESLQKDLFAADEKNKHTICKVIRRRTAALESELKDECMFKIPSEEILDQLSSRLTPEEAFHLFIELGLDRVEIDRARINFSRESLEQIKHMLRLWRRQTEPRPTFKVLEEAIIEVGINIRELKQIAPEIMKTK